MRTAPPPAAFDEPLLGKNTALIALAMSALIVCGVLGVSGLMKLRGYGRPEMMDPTSYTWSALAVFFRNHGFLLLWVPVVWTLVTVWFQRRDRGEAHTGMVALGTALMAVFLMLFFVAALRPVEEKSLLLWLIENRKDREAAAAAEAADGADRK